MEFFTADKYISYPRSEAYNKFLDDKNLKSFKTYIKLAIIFFMFSLVINLFDKFSVVVLTVVGINLLFLVILQINYKRLLNSDNIRKFLYFYLIAQIVYACLINFSYILAGPEDETAELTRVTQDSIETIETNDTGIVSSDTVITDSSAADKTQTKDTLYKNDKGNVSVTLDLGSIYDSFSEWLMVMGVSLVFFGFPRDRMYKLWALGFVLPITCELLVYGTLQKDDYVAYGTLYVILFTAAYFSDKKSRKKFNEQYDFYLKKNFESLRMKKELDSAREIQLSMLPENNSVINNIDIAGISLPASEVGGDYFDYFKISDTKLGVFICDVSGHGVASGLMLSGIRSCMHLILEDDDDPQRVMEKLNRMVRKTQHRKMFVTAIFALIDTEKNECKLFNAGHLPPYKLSASSEDIFKIRKHGITLGAIENISLPNNESEVIFDFNPGDKIVFYTDGLNEAMNPVKAEYGFERIENTLFRNTDKTPAELIDLLLNDVRTFTGGNEQIDDLTILIIERK